MQMKLACAVLAVACLCLSARAEELSGTLVDAAGRPVAGRLLHFYHGPRAQLLSVRTDAKGHYATGGKLVGPCSLIVAEAGEGGPLSRVVFLAKDVALKAGELRTLDLKLEAQRPSTGARAAFRSLGASWPARVLSGGEIVEWARPDGWRADAFYSVGAQNGELKIEETKAVVRARAKRGVIEVDSGRLGLRLADGAGEAQAPVLALRGPDAKWFGAGTWERAGRPTCRAKTTGAGTGRLTHRLIYSLAGGGEYVVTIVVRAGEDCFEIHEECSKPAAERWVLDLSAGYAPDRYREFRYYQAFAPKPIPTAPQVLASLQPWTFCGIMDYRETTSVFQSEGRRDAVAVFSVDGSRWTLAGKPFRTYADFSSRDGWRTAGGETAVKLERRAGGTALVFPLQAGVRMHGVAVYDKDDDRTRYKAVDARLLLSDTPLADVLGMKLAWDAPTDAPLPHGGLDAWKAVAARADAKDTFAYGYLNGRRDLIPKLRAALFALDRRLLDYYVWPPDFPADKPRAVLNGYIGKGQRLIEVGPQARQFAELVDWSLAMGVLSSEEMTRVRATMAFLACKLADPELQAGLSALGNFKVDGYYALLLLAIELKGHPDRQRFLDEYRRQLRQDVEEGLYLYSDGGGNECPIYRAMSLNFLVRQAWYLARHPDCGIDLLGNERLKLALGWLAESTMPPIPKVHAATARVLPLIGDTTLRGSAQFGLFGLAAEVYRERDARLAANMLWWWNLMGRPIFWGHGLDDPYSLNRMVFGTQSRRGKQVTRAFGAGTPPAAPGSRTIDGVGFIFRKDWNTPDEFSLLLKAGRSSGHDHPDDGGFQFYAWGQAISVGYAKYPYMTDGWRYDLVRFDGRSNWSRGEVTAFLPSDLCDAAGVHVPVANVSINRELSLREQFDRNKHFEDSTWEFVRDVPPSGYDRFVIFNRADDHFVLYDVTGPRYETDWFAHVMSDDYHVARPSSGVKPAGGGRATPAGDGLVSFPGRYGVGLDLHLLRPAGAKPEILAVVPKQFAAEIAAGRLKWRTGQYIDQTVVRLHQPAGSEYLTVWQPRKPATPVVEVKAAGADAFAIAGAKSRTLVVCRRTAGEVSVPGLRLRGRVGYTVTSGDRVVAGLLSGTALSRGRCTFTCADGTAVQASLRAGALEALCVYAREAGKVTVDTGGAAVKIMEKKSGRTQTGARVVLSVGPGLTVFVCEKP